MFFINNITSRKLLGEFDIHFHLDLGVQIHFRKSVTPVILLQCLYGGDEMKAKDYARVKQQVIFFQLLTFQDKQISITSVTSICLYNPIYVWYSYSRCINSLLCNSAELQKKQETDMFSPSYTHRNQLYKAQTNFSNIQRLVRVAGAGNFVINLSSPRFPAILCGQLLFSHLYYFRIQDMVHIQLSAKLLKCLTNNSNIKL